MLEALGPVRYPLMGLKICPNKEVAAVQRTNVAVDISAEKESTHVLQFSTALITSELYFRADCEESDTEVLLASVDQIHSTTG